MNWSIDDREVLLALNDFRVDRDTVNHIKINLIHFLTNNGNQLVVTLELDVLIVHLVDFVDDALIVWSKHLCTIIPISLVAIVLTRVVAGSDVHTTLATEVTNSEAHFWRWTKVVEKININAVSRENLSTSLSKKTRIVAAIVTYHHTNLIASCKVLVQIVGKSLSCSTYRVDIHAVCTSTHDATESTCTKLKCLIEAIDEARLIFSLNQSLGSSLSVSVKNWVSCPLLSNFRTLL